jgi:hypothetical protein
MQLAKTTGCIRRLGVFDFLTQYCQNSWSANQRFYEESMMMRVVRNVGLLVAMAFVLAACGGPATATTAPTQAPAAAATSAPANTATTAPPTATTAPPTATTAPPTATTAAQASPTTPRERVSFLWAPGSNKPSDADDVADILLDLKTNPGILGGTGDESGINIQYDPTVITVDEIIKIMAGIGHPVVLP